MAKKSVVRVNIERRDGWHIATSPDLIGLIAGHPSLTVLLQEIPRCIQGLYKWNLGQEVDVEELPLIDGDISSMCFEAIRKAA